MSSGCFVYIKTFCYRTHAADSRILLFAERNRPNSESYSHAYDPPFSHCDIQFEDNMASSVYSGEKVYWKKRGFKKPGYSRITLSADTATYNKAYSMCEERAKDGYDFDAIGMYTLPLP